MDADTVKRLDEMEQELIEKMGHKVRNGYFSDAEKASRTLVNIAMYRRLRAGDRMRLRSDGTVDLAEAR